MREPLQVPIERLRELFRYDPETGVLHRINGRGKNRRVGYTRADGYMPLCVDYTMLLTHRVAWAMAYGYWPTKHLDHIDRDPSNNRLSNLRECDDRENQQNLSAAGKGSTGYLGVHIDPRRSDRWIALIGHQKKTRYIGYYRCPTAAYVAYCREKTRLHTFATGGVGSPAIS